MMKKIYLTLFSLVILDVPMMLRPTQSNLNPWLYNTVSVQDAFRQVKNYMGNIIKEFNIQIEATAQQSLLRKSGHMLLHYGPRLTPQKVKKVKKQLKQYLLLTFPHSYHKGTQKDMRLVQYARQAISFAITQYLMGEMNIKSSALIRAYKRTLRKSIKEDIFAHQHVLTSGYLALSTKNIKTIINNAISHLKNMDPATRQQVEELAQQIEQESATQQELISLSQKTKRKTERKQFFFESLESARVAIQEEIREQGVSPQDREKLLHSIMEKVAHQTKNEDKISEAFVYNIAIGSIDVYKNKQSATCAICDQKVPRRAYFNKRAYKCGHVVHKTCLFKKNGKHYHYQGMRYGKCPDCETTQISN